MEKSSKLPIILALAMALAIPAEGLRQRAYRDPPGILTVCYGHTGNVDKFKTYSLAECKALLNADMTLAVNMVLKRWPWLPEKVAAAIADAVFNIGPRIIDPKQSTLARLLDKGDIVGACNQLPRWDKSTIGGILVTLPGLTKRRNAEMNLCLEGAYEK